MEARGSVRWANAFLYAIVTTVMVLSTAVLLSIITQGSQRELVKRVDHNTTVSAQAADAIICILQLGVGPDDPPRSTANVDACIKQSGLVLPDHG